MSEKMRAWERRAIRRANRPFTVSDAIGRAEAEREAQEPELTPSDREHPRWAGPAGQAAYEREQGKALRAALEGAKDGGRVNTEAREARAWEALQAARRAPEQLCFSFFTP